MQGRISQGLAALRECGEENVAMAIEEQELSRLGLGFLDRLKLRLIAACDDGRVTGLELAELLKGIDNIDVVITKQLEYDLRDEHNGRAINIRVGQVIETRETAKQRTALESGPSQPLTA